MVNIIRVEGVRESYAYRQERINDACSSLFEIGFPRKLFAIHNLMYNGFTEEQFLELIEPISSVTNLDDLRFLFNAARESLLYTSSTTASEFRNFVKCMNWLKDELSKKAMADAALEKKNPEKKKEMSKADIVLAQMLLDYAAPRTRELKRIQSEIDELKKRQKELEVETGSASISVAVDYTASSSSTQQDPKRFKTEIGELKKRQKDLETESENIVEDLKLKLGPIYEYEEPSITELKIESYKLYEIDCRFKGITATPILDEMGYATVVDVFGGIVKDRHFVKFLNDPVRRESIENYFKEGADSG